MALLVLGIYIPGVGREGEKEGKESSGRGNGGRRLRLRLVHGGDQARLVVSFSEWMGVA
jgi:hypothetical protein